MNQPTLLTVSGKIKSSTWIKEGCRKGIYYQTTRAIFWNILRITTADAIMRCDIFHLFVGRNEKRKPVMERNCWLSINIEGHIANLCGLFRYYKNMALLTIISLHKNILLPSCCRTEKKLVLSWKRRWFRWWHSPSCLVKFLRYHYELHFPAIAMWYSRSVIMTMKAPVP